MARYRGPRGKLSRREHEDLFLFSSGRDISGKCNFTKLPGEKVNQPRPRRTDYAVQLREKQKVRRIYGVLEKQFRNYYKKASRQLGSTGYNLLKLLELRLDNIVYTSGLACTRAEARQLVNHNSICVNGKRVNIPSYIVSVGDEITVWENAKSQKRLALSIDKFKTADRQKLWLETDLEQMKITVSTLPTREEIYNSINENLIVEFYSK